MSNKLNRVDDKHTMTRIERDAKKKLKRIGLLTDRSMTKALTVMIDQELSRLEIELIENTEIAR